MDALLRRRAMIAAGGSEPSPLVYYDRLVFDGTAYIETDIIPDALSSFRVSIGDEANKAAQRYFYTTAENSSFIGVALSSSTTSSNRSFIVYYGSTSTVSSGKTLDFSNARMGFFLTPYRFGFGKLAYTFTKGANAPNGGLMLGCNPSHSGNPFSGTMGTFRIYGSDAQNVTVNSEFDSYAPAYTLRPCTYNGEAGMWCVETGTFYGNTAGSGSLTVENNS